MPTNTSKLNLVKPLAEENYDVGVFNSNADKIDQFATNIDLEKVDKVDGKGLSTEDYTAGEKAKVANLPLDTNSKLAEKANQATTYTKTEVDNALALKANKTQEAWITPTLLNGWIPFNETLSTAQYMKDELGFVSLRGIIKSGSAGLIFTLPTTYRPEKNVYVATVSNGVFGYIIVGSTGAVTAITYSNNWISLENIRFKAGV